MGVLKRKQELDGLRKIDLGLSLFKYSEVSYIYRFIAFVFEHEKWTGLNNGA